MHSVDEKEAVPYWTIYRYCSGLDYALIAVGTLGALVGGAALPVFSILLGEVVSAVGQSRDGLVAKVNELVVYFIVLAAVAAVGAGLEMVCWMRVGIRQSGVIRDRYLRAVMRQDVAFFDTEASSGGLIQSLNEDTAAIQEGMNDKAATFLHNLGAAVAAVAIGFWRAWDIFVVALASWPVLIISGVFFTRTAGWMERKQGAAYAQAGRVAQESFANIRVVAAYSGEAAQTARYAGFLTSVKQVVAPLSFANGVTLGLFQFTLFATYALVFYWGGIRVAEGGRTGGDVINIMFATMIGGFSLGMAAPYTKYFRLAQIAAARVFRVIDRPLGIGGEPGARIPEGGLAGKLELRDVAFS